ncbi:glycosyltransferase family 2 protein [Streptomyces sp. NPDC056773]|uniref:glycosyltransferase family 2 protein n=1 Tax=unclassified Streptomyces TaxID=2593676 RepID=UPI0036C48843
MSHPLVTVVTPTKGRPEVLVERALSSVARSEGVRVQHVVLGDDCPFLREEANRRELAERFPHAEFVNVAPEDHPADASDYLPARVSRIRNAGIDRARGAYVAHLDDDNAYQPGHLRSLVDALDAEPGAGVAYSWRRLLTADGSPFVPEGEDPWHPVPARRAASYESLRRQGVFVPGSDVVRDAMRVVDGLILSRVDTNELMVRRDVHARIPFPTEFSLWQRVMQTTEDMALCQRMLEEGVASVCTGEATVDYYMGGYSNAEAIA